MKKSEKMPKNSKKCVFLPKNCKNSVKKSRFLVFAFILTIPFFVFGCDQNVSAKNQYQICATYDDQAQTLSCVQTVEYFCQSEEPLSSVCFYVYANAFAECAVTTAYVSKAYPNGISYGGIEISTISVDGQQTNWDLNESILTVSVENGICAGESVQIEMEYVVTLANIRHRLGYCDESVNFGNFFPIACVFEGGEFVKNGYSKNGDSFYSDISDFSMQITFPSGYVFASTGTAEIEQEDERCVATCTAENVRDFCFVLSQNFQTASQEVDGVTVTYYFYDDNSSASHLETAAKAIQTFDELFGKYPYQTLAVVQTGFCFGGMEYPNLVMIADDSGDATDYVIVHEIAHQWWYGLVGNNEWQSAWLDEGLTEFSAALFYENNAEYGLTYEQIMDSARSTYQNFVSIYASVLGQVDESMNRALDEFATEPEYVNISYTKGMLLFDALRSSMSEAKFKKCLQEYFENFKFKNVSVEEFVTSFSDSSGRNLKNFINSWLNGEVKIGA